MDLAEFEKVEAALFERFKLPADERHATSVLAVAIEAAVAAVEMGGPDPFAIAHKAVEILPRSSAAAYFRRGLTFGLALALASETTVELRLGDADGIVLPASLRIGSEWLPVEDAPEDAECLLGAHVADDGSYELAALRRYSDGWNIADVQCGGYYKPTTGRLYFRPESLIKPPGVT